MNNENIKNLNQNVKNQLVSNQENKVANVKTGKVALVAQTELYTNMLATSFENMQIEFTPYKKICMINALMKMKELLISKGKDFNSKDIDQSNIVSILNKVSMLELNLAASPAECYLQFRNVKQYDDTYKLSFEFGIEGNGNDALLRNFGVDVKDVKGAFVVREGDDFTYPYFDGEKMIPPTWKPKSFYKKPIKVFYIITKKDGSKEFLISEREEVVKNLQAHISNNLMGVSSIEKNAILDKISNMTLENILDDKSLRKITIKDKTITLISPAWANPQSREDMILRKMKNNATKKYPKDFKNSYIENEYESTFEDYDQYRTSAPIHEEVTQDVINKQVDENLGTKKITLDNNNSINNNINSYDTEESVVNYQEQNQDEFEQKQSEEPIIEGNSIKLGF